MTQRKIRCTVVAASLAAVLALAAPAQAASHPRANARSGWLETVLQWVTGGWAGGGASGSGGQIPGQKSDKGIGVDPNGSTATTLPTDSSTDKGIGVDPNG
jgi:hypothetical protein